MPHYDPTTRRWYCFFIDAALAKDSQGWEFYFRTPLFGLTLTHFFPQLVEMVRCNRVAFGLFCRWPLYDGEMIYRFNWEKK